MRCIQFSATFPPSHLIPRHILKPKKLFFPSIQESTRLNEKLEMRTRAMTNHLILAATSPTKGGDISVLLPTGALLLFVYGIANFVVPALISKYFGFDKVSEESVPTDDSSSGN